MPRPIVACPSRLAYQATIRRTAHNIPHITAADFGSLGYGYGYAFAEDNICAIADAYVTVRAERSRFFGPEGSYRFEGRRFKESSRYFEPDQQTRHDHLRMDLVERGGDALQVGDERVADRRGIVLAERASHPIENDRVRTPQELLVRQLRTDVETAVRESRIDYILLDHRIRRLEDARLVQHRLDGGHAFLLRGCVDL